MLKIIPVAIVALFVAACTPFSDLLPGSAGNPVNDPYAGSPGSAYDATANPPRALGVVAYDPDKQQPLPADEAMPAAPGSIPAR